MLLFAVAVAVAVAVADTFRMGGDHESYKSLVRSYKGLIRLYNGLIRPYPSLSFVEYNSSQDLFFTPLVYFLAGHYLDP